ncbi:MAG: replication-associated protein [Tirithivirus golfim]|uniref:Replication-associated protein n=1 Tax=Cressdnaviricota sp. TaxID=2748378 RepID=A0A3G2YTB4_9VIRU|nr:MAG: replication-associated protein [Cressdnaviricota sp.]
MDAEGMDAERVGNTSLRARAFQFTLNEIDRWEELEDYLLSLKTCDYCIACKEKAPTTGHEHIHCYAHFSTSRNISIKKCAGAHIEICRGSPQQNIAYIEKDGDIITEWGTRPRQGGWHNVAELRAIDNPDDLSSTEYSKWLQVKSRTKIKIADVFKNDLVVYYITGDSGAGKSKRAFEILAENGYEECDMISYENGFYNGVSDGCGACIYDDWRPSDMKASEFIKMIDYNVHPMNVKGGHVLNRYRIVIITSIIKPQHIYTGLTSEAREQWMRRMKIIDLTPTNDWSVCMDDMGL